MKKIYLLLPIVIPLLASCEDEAEELTTITEDVTLTEIVPVVATGSQLVTTFNGSFQAEANTQYANFGDKIDGIVVRGITITILDNGSYINDNPATASLVDGTVSFEFTGGSLTASLPSNQNIDAIVGVVLEANISESGLENLASQLLASDEISYSVFAEVSEAVAFDMEVTIELEVSGSIIN